MKSADPPGVVYPGSLCLESVRKKPCLGGNLGLGFRVQASGYKVQGSLSRVSGFFPFSGSFALSRL